MKPPSSDDKDLRQSEQVFEVLARRQFDHPLLNERNRAQALAFALRRAETAPQPVQVALSSTAENVLQLAGSLASGGAVTPLMVLAGFFHEGRELQVDTAGCIYQLARSIPELGRWMDLVGNPHRGTKLSLDQPGLARPLNRAIAYARFTGTYERQVQARHLAAAILAPALDGPSELEADLRWYKESEDVIASALTRMREELARYLAEGEPQYDPPGTWRIVFNLPAILAAPPIEQTAAEPAEPIRQARVEPVKNAPNARPEDTRASKAPETAAAAPVEQVAGVRSDAVDGVDLSDRLGIEPDVNALASIIAARSVEPPLAIGLFGNWGTGKSFFMSKMEKRLRMICERAAVEDSVERTYYFSDIAQIRFNAWHYADGNLWASLMARIFEGLSLYGIEKGREDVEEKLREQLRSAEFVLGDAQGQLAAAQARRQQAELHARNVQQQQRQVEEAFVRKVGAETLQSVQDQLSSQIEARWPRFGPKELLKWHAQLQERWGRARELWAWVRQGGRPRVTLLLAAVAAAAAGAVVASQLDTMMGSRTVTQAIPVVGGLVLSVIGWIARYLPKVDGVLESLKAARERIDAADKSIAEETQKVLGALEAEEGRAREVARKASEEVTRIKEDLSKAQPTRRLRDFLAERNESADYRRHLGLVSLIRNDLSALSDLLRDARDTESAGLPTIERIVLYIDDLDRCPEDRIVQVLEAVHLLLAFPLFVVVVGVDSRWLLHALKKRYEAFSDDEAATPQAYLEKIFQIPFTLKRIEEDGFGKLIDFLLPAKAAQAASAADTAAQKKLAVAAASQEKQSPRQPAQGDQPQPKGEQPATVHGVQRTANAPVPVPTPAPSLGLQPKLLELGEEEVRFIKRMWRLIPTPRATNRLANCYRLLRVRVSKDKEAGFRGEKGTPGTAEYPLVVLLLSMMIGFPEEFSRILQLAKDDTSASDWAAFKEKFTHDPAFEPLTRALRQIDAPEAGWVPMAKVRYWLEVVCRFSFHLRDEVLSTDARGGSATKRLANSITRNAGATEGAPSPEAAPAGPRDPPDAGAKA